MNPPYTPSFIEIGELQKNIQLDSSHTLQRKSYPLHSREVVETERKWFEKSTVRRMPLEFYTGKSVISR